MLTKKIYKEYTMPHFQMTTDFPDASAEDLFAWHESPHAFKRLLPPWEPVRLKVLPPDLKNGSTAQIQIPFLGRITQWIPTLKAFSFTWHAEHRGYLPPFQFIDTQASGAFSVWQHLHEMSRVDASTARLCDFIQYALPLEPLSSGLAGWAVQAKLRRMFRFRHRITGYDLKRRNPSLMGKRILVTGASGMLGTPLVATLLALGMQVRVLLRTPPSQEAKMQWQGVELVVCDSEQDIPPQVFEEVYGVISLNGESIAQRWTPDRKKRMRESRVDWTKKLVQTCLSSGHTPSVWIGSSGVSCYPEETALTEHHYSEDTPIETSHFLGALVKDWEDALHPLGTQGVRVCHARISVLMDESGGYMQRLSLPFAWGGIFNIGTGKPPFAWMSLEDAIGAMIHLLGRAESQGVYHFVAPEVVDSQALHQKWAKALGVPFWGNLPAWMLALVFGKDMVEAFIEKGVAVIPKKLVEEGFTFLHPDLEALFAHAVDIQDFPEWLMSKL
jgi:uncharacterized protein (TIGR01777 family)